MVAFPCSRVVGAWSDCVRRHSMPPLDALYGCWWGAAYLLIVLATSVVFAGVERQKKFDLANHPWEGSEAVNHPRRSEGETL
jgi:hypothetical protein